MPERKSNMKKTIALLLFFSSPAIVFAAAPCDSQAELDLAQYAALRAEHQAGSLAVCEHAYPLESRPGTYAVSCSPSPTADWQWTDYVTLQDCQIISVTTHEQ
jgi:hypothetical protein